MTLVILKLAQDNHLVRFWSKFHKFHSHSKVFLWRSIIAVKDKLNSIIWYKIDRNNRFVSPESGGTSSQGNSNNAILWKLSISSRQFQKYSHTWIKPPTWQTRMFLVVLTKYGHTVDSLTKISWRPGCGDFWRKVSHPQNNELPVSPTQKKVIASPLKNFIDPLSRSVFLRISFFKPLHVCYNINLHFTCYVVYQLATILIITEKGMTKIYIYI